MADPSISSKSSRARSKGGSSSRKGKNSHSHKKKKTREPRTQDAGEPPREKKTAGATTATTRERSTTPSPRNGDEREGSEAAPRGACCSCCRRSTTTKTTSDESCCDKFLSFFGLKHRKKVEDFVVLDDDASLDRSLLWDEEGSKPTSGDYLNFTTEHERGITERASDVRLPSPPKDRIDY